MAARSDFRGFEGKATPIGAATVGMLRTFTSGVASSIIGDEDTRRTVTNTSIRPWRMICALEINAPLGLFHGTGWLAGPRAVITCGHCVYQPVKLGGRASSIKVIPGRYRGSAPFRTFESSNFSVLDEWTASLAPSADVACIHLPEAIGDRLGWFALAVVDPAQLVDRPVGTAGYSEFDNGFGRMQRSEGIGLGVVDGRLLHSADTMGGHSGGPVWLEPLADEVPRVVAVHAYDERESPGPHEANSGPVMNASIAGRIARWASQ